MRTKLLTLLYIKLPSIIYSSMFKFAVNCLQAVVAFSNLCLNFQPLNDLQMVLEYIGYM